MKSVLGALISATDILAENKKAYLPTYVSYQTFNPSPPSITVTEGSATIYVSKSARESALQSIFEKATLELSRYSSFPCGWDGYRGQSFQKKTLGIAQNILESSVAYFAASGVTPSKITPGPCPDGSVQLEIACNDRSVLTTIAPDTSSLEIYEEGPEGDHERVVEMGQKSLEAELHRLSGASMVPLAVDSDK